MNFIIFVAIIRGEKWHYFFYFFILAWELKANNKSNNEQSCKQCFGSGLDPIWIGSRSGLDPESIRSVDPDPDSESASGSRRAKMTHKNRKKFRNFIFWGAGCSFWKPEGFFCSLDVLYGGLRIGKLQFVWPKNITFFQLVNFFQFWSSKPWIRVGSGSVFSLNDGSGFGIK